MHDAAVLADKIRALSPEQITEVEDFVDFLRLRSETRGSSRAMSGASEPAFEAVWNNPEDDAYDAL
jgi:hypothetical protein